MAISSRDQVLELLAQNETEGAIAILTQHPDLLFEHSDITDLDITTNVVKVKIPTTTLHVRTSDEKILTTCLENVRLNCHIVIKDYFDNEKEQHLTRLSDLLKIRILQRIQNNLFPNNPSAAKQLVNKIDIKSVIDYIVNIGCDQQMLRSTLIDAIVAAVKKEVTNHLITTNGGQKTTTYQVENRKTKQYTQTKKYTNISILLFAIIKFTERNENYLLRILSLLNNISCEQYQYKLLGALTSPQVPLPLLTTILLSLDDEDPYYLLKSLNPINFRAMLIALDTLVNENHEMSQIRIDKINTLHSAIRILSPEQTAIIIEQGHVDFSQFPLSESLLLIARLTDNKAAALRAEIFASIRLRLITQINQDLSSIPLMTKDLTDEEFVAVCENIDLDNAKNILSQPNQLHQIIIIYSNSHRLMDLLSQLINHTNIITSTTLFLDILLKMDQHRAVFIDRLFMDQSGKLPENNQIESVRHILFAENTHLFPLFRENFTQSLPAGITPEEKWSLIIKEAADHPTNTSAKVLAIMYIKNQDGFCDTAEKIAEFIRLYNIIRHHQPSRLMQRFWKTTDCTNFILTILDLPPRYTQRQ